MHVKSYERKLTDKPASLVSIKISLFVPEKEKKEIDDLSLGDFLVDRFVDFYVSRNLTLAVEFGKDSLLLTVDDIKG